MRQCPATSRMERLVIAVLAVSVLAAQASPKERLKVKYRIKKNNASGQQLHKQKVADTRCRCLYSQHIKCIVNERKMFPSFMTLYVN